MAYLSGRHSSDGQQFGTYSQDDVDALRAIAEEPGVVDIFLTYPFQSKIFYSFHAQSFIVLLDFGLCSFLMTSLINYH